MKKTIYHFKLFI